MERIGDRFSISEAAQEAARAVRLQLHAGVIGQVRLCDGAVAGPIRQLKV